MPSGTEARMADGIAEQRTTRGARHSPRFRFPSLFVARLIVARLGACFPREPPVYAGIKHSKD
ncbi:hypothetical protein K0M31_004473 [Melipona bicolor]|uniref:Uncharacterized protein n=1 Tax=Melipona bicolor TaxID=60889 RepID=A0AA40FWY7_9HYME|nr:hypothetical protein K0M31_004473 [Melipona bicolor]